MQLKIMVVALVLLLTLATAMIAVWASSPSIPEIDPSCTGFNERVYALRYFRKRKSFDVGKWDSLLSMRCHAIKEFEGNDRECVALYERYGRNAPMELTILFSSRRCEKSRPLTMSDELD
jgi:hypothetical protein